MGNKNQLVVVPNGAWELKIPKLHVDTLQNMIGQDVQILTTPGYPAEYLRDQKKSFPSMIVLPSDIDWNLERQYVSNFISQRSDFPWVLWDKRPGIITPEWYMKLPQSVLDLFQKNNTRAKFILLQKSGKNNGFAISIQDLFPGKK